MPWWRDLVQWNGNRALIWRTNIQYHLIVNDWLGRIAYYMRSKDGINWKTEPGEAYMPGIAKYEDGTVENWFKYERIKVLQDEYGRATQAHFAVIDVLKHDDKASDNHSSKHIIIPLTVGRLLTVLNKAPITGNTETIQVKVMAEEGFDPHTDIDLDSLRFGASEEVNFGRGCRVRATEKSGSDLIVTFTGEGNGLTEKNFAAKLLGKTSRGELLFGYARLPGINYLEPALSPLLPRFSCDQGKCVISVEVQNFGQVESGFAEIKIKDSSSDNGSVLAEGEIPMLKPFQKTTIEFACDEECMEKMSAPVKVVIEP